MGMMRHPSRLVPMAVIAVLALGACGSGDDDSAAENTAPGGREQRRRPDRAAADRDVGRRCRGRIGERHGGGADRRPLDGDRHDRPVPDHELRGWRFVAGTADQRHRLGVPGGRGGDRRPGRPTGDCARRHG